MGDTNDVTDDRATPEQRRAAMAYRRGTCPVGRLGRDADSGPWYLAGYGDVDAALREVLHFGGAAGAGDVAEDLQSFNGFLEPQHGKVRKIVNGLVAAHRARAAEPFIRRLSADLLDRLAAQADAEGHRGGDHGPGIDVMAGLVDQLPCAVVAWLLGWPTDDPVQLYRWTVLLCERAMEMTPGGTLSSADLCPEFAAYVDERIASRLAIDEADWPDDGLTHMLTAEIDGQRLSRTMVRTQLIFVLGAGSETSRDLIGGLLYDMATDSALYRRVRADRSLVPAAVEEALRLWSPTQFMVRRCLSPIGIAGTAFQTGDVVTLGLASANRDEAVYTGPDAFDLDRPNSRSHLAFGAGPHVCPGAALARAEAQIVLNAFLDRFEAAEVAESGFEAIPLAMFSGPKTLRLRLTPA